MLFRSGIDPCPLGARSVTTKPRMKIGIVPMASSPLRTLPPTLVQNITKLLSQHDADITIVLNAYQGVMKAYKAALGSFSAKNIQILDGFKTIGALVGFVEQQDYVRSEEHTSELQSHHDIVFRLLLEKKK